ncbi:MAG: PIF1 family ATP-dependent DNA helicase [Candidatus Saccharibacteria bacterium]|nr:PIF1 family ATP-dependent DNA helicase [Candidatus Saccharibacteria bacterium]
MKQTLALAILDAGHSIFLTGPAGSGKTYVLNQFIKDARADGKSVAVTASTGLAATHLGGNTIHSWAGIGIADELHKKHVADFSKSRREQIENADILIIDEVSMLHDYRLDMVDQICRQVRGKLEVPFGGLQVILSGDFFQLPPVNREESKQGSFVIGSKAWQELDPVICYLEEQHRQEDEELLEILTALRSNDLRRRHAETLLSRKITRTPFDDPVTELYTTNINVDSVNDAKLQAMEGELHEYEMTSSGRKGAVESLKKSCLSPETLQLKKGAFVMFVKNSPEKKYVNGTLGTVVGFAPGTDYPIVETKNGRRIETKPDSWEMKDGEKKVASLSQIPLRLAWAITVHKSQGMTLDGAHVDLSRAFVSGMGYVALSRVKSLKSLTLGGLNRTALTMHEESYDIDDTLRIKSSKDAKRLAELEEAYVENRNKRIEKRKTGTTKGSTSWQEKLDHMRAEYPNAYKPWKRIEDETLLNQWAAGKKIKELAKILGRHDGSIRSRLKKHLGEDLFSK